MARIAGYDTLIASEGSPDEVILKKAIQEGRYLLTMDKYFLKSNFQKIIYFREVGLKKCVKELSETIEVNWLYKPLSRCLICNAEVIKVYQDDISKKNSKHEDVVKCPICRRYYWHGSHYKAMVKQLKQWQNHEWS